MELLGPGSTTAQRCTVTGSLRHSGRGFLPLDPCSLIVSVEEWGMGIYGYGACKASHEYPSSDFRMRNEIVKLDEK